MLERNDRQRLSLNFKSRLNESLMVRSFLIRYRKLVTVLREDILISFIRTKSFTDFGWTRRFSEMHIRSPKNLKSYLQSDSVRFSWSWWEIFRCHSCCSYNIISWAAFQYLRFCNENAGSNFCCQRRGISRSVNPETQKERKRVSVPHFNERVSWRRMATKSRLHRQGWNNYKYVFGLHQEA